MSLLDFESPRVSLACFIPSVEFSEQTSLVTEIVISSMKVIVESSVRSDYWHVDGREKQIRSS